MADEPLPEGDPRHGLNGYTNLGCRCDICREAQRLKHWDYMERHPEQREKHRIRRMQRWRAQRR
jgi:hypothetical protein